MAENTKNTKNSKNSKNSKNVENMTKETFRSNLAKSNKSIQATRANRIASVAKMEYENLVNNKKREIFNIENDLEAMADISTSNVSTTVNAVGFDFDGASFVNKRAKLRDNLIITKEELKVLESNADFYE